MMDDRKGPIGDHSESRPRPSFGGARGGAARRQSELMTEDEPKRVHTAPRRRPRPATVRVPSLVLINTGNGKGKTTAALGTALRAIAQGWPVGLIQFMKSGRWKVGEERIARSLGVDWWTIGAGFTWEVKDIDQARATAEEAWRVAAERIDSD